MSDKKLQRTLYEVYIVVNSIENSKTMETGHKDVLEFSEKDLMMINKVHEQPNLFPFIVNSISPKIYGHEMIKGILRFILFYFIDVLRALIIHI